MLNISWILALFILPIVTNAIEWTDLRCKFSMFDVFRMDSFYQLPRSENEAKLWKWQEPPESVHEKFLTTYCEKNDGRICILYDKKGATAGYQIGISTKIDDMRIPHNDLLKKGFNKTILFGDPFYTIRSYFVPKDVIHSHGRTYNGLIGTGLWLQIGQSLVEIPRNENELSYRIPFFKKQNCFSKMGRHYFYNISSKVTPEEFVPFFILYSNEGELQGFGMIAFGSNNPTKKTFRDYMPFLKKRNWFETVNSSAIKKVAPDAPQWILDYAEKYGVISHHIYMIPSPWKFTCKESNTSKVV